MLMNIKKTSFQCGKDNITLETGRIARQAHGSVLVTLNEDTQVLVTLVSKNLESVKDFFPLSVHYIEKTYAAGKIPGGYFKREGKPSEKEVLTSRLIDRAIRPLFPAEFQNEVQVIATVVSANKNIDPDIPAIIGTSAVISLSKVPFLSSVAAVRVGYINSEYVVNPTYNELESSKLNMVVAASKEAVLMVESEASELNEQVMLEAIMFAHQKCQDIIENINSLSAQIEDDNTQKWQLQEKYNTELLSQLKNDFSEDIANAYQIRKKQQRVVTLEVVKKTAVDKFTADEKYSQQEVLELFKKLEKSIVRENIIQTQTRIDGRGLDDVRDISIEVGVLANSHGSALFTRGETQSLGSVTLGAKSEGQLLEVLEHPTRIEDNFLFHYNFPPYCVGEVGMVGATKRREVGHGRLARRSLNYVIPNIEKYPYTIRMVSEITESNGSSSMASVCSASLSLLHAGVPIKTNVAGIAMGLVKEDENFIVLTDIMGDEDHLGDMDFKVAGTNAGITALQMDIKIQGITKDILSYALEKALKARMSILEKMNAVISEPNKVSDKAPKVFDITIAKDKIRVIIGKGGETIKAISAKSSAVININDDGNINIFAQNQENLDIALSEIKKLTAEPEIGAIYTGKVMKIVQFGAFINIMPNCDGLLHISEIANEKVNDVNDYLQENKEIRVKIIGIDRGKIKLSAKALLKE